MAACTFAQRLVVDLGVLLASATVIDLSRQRDATATENTARTARVAQLAAAKIESRLGSAGAYDDADGTVGDQKWIDLGLRLAVLYYSQIYSLVLTEAGTGYLASVLEELEMYSEVLRQEASLGIIARVDNDARNARYPHSTWGSTTDPDTAPEI